MTECESWLNVGRRIRKLRKENHLTLKQLAAGCGLSPNAISLVERGEVAPTVMTLCKIGHALGVSPGIFFQDICSTEVILTRAQAGEQAQTESAFQLLSGEGAFHEGGGENDRCLPSGMTQMVLCLHGPIEYEVDDQSYLLYPGDSLTFNGEAFHRWRNHGPGTGVAVMVLTATPEKIRQEAK